MKTTLHLIATFVFAPLVSLTSLQAADAPKPNIVFIFADDLGWGDISCHGAEEWLKTPHIDRLAGEGIDFSQFNVLSPVCSSSRAAMMTGRYSFRYSIHTALLFASIAALHAADGYPAFSWDRVPVYAHFGYDPKLTPEQYDFLARRFPLVTFAAGSVRKEAEKGIAAGAAEIKKRNPSVKVLFYFATDILHEPFTLSNESFPREGFIEKPSVKKTVNPRTGKQSEQVRYYFDKSKPVTREWWAGIAGKAVKEYGCDGVFADGLGSYGRNLVTPEKEAAMRAGIMTMCQLAHEKMGPHGLIIFNPLHGEENADLLPATDGAMIDNFDRTLFRADDTTPTTPDARSLDLMAEGIEAMSKASKRGKIVIFKAWPGFHQKDKELMKRPHEELVKLARERLTFPLASFLIAAGPHCYFQYTWGWNADNGTFDWHPEFDKPLGPPKGDAKRDGFKYTREFEHASVFVDLQTKSAKIDWK